MSSAIYAAAAGAMLNQRRLEILSNNLANINSIGFKKDLANLRIAESPADVAESIRNLSLNGPAATAPIWVRLESRTAFQQGQLKHTGNPFDLALEGEGFFVVETPSGNRYTRKGNFTRSAEGDLVTAEGHTVLGEGGPVRIDGRSFSVDEKGNVSVDNAEVDQLRIVNFTDSQQLRKIGDNLFAPATDAATGQSAESVTVSQGFVELSNVDAVRTMTDMIDVLRGYESYQKVIRAIDETNARAINEVGKVG